MPELFQETALVEAADIAADGSFPIRFITAGWGSSGYYSPTVLESATSLFAEGTPMFLDHATASEKLERPIRSVKDIAATITTPGTYNAAENAIDGRATLVPGPYRETVKALKKTIGVSINGGGTFREGEAEQRSGRIVESLDEIRSVDFVTRPGRGGKILEAVLESAVAEAAVLNVDEATASDRMDHLRSAVRFAHGGDQKSAWVRDQDAEQSTVWFDVHDYRDDQPHRTFQQTYKVGRNDVDVQLVGNPTEVRSVTKYVPVSPAGPTPTKESKEDTMATTQIEESEHTRLVEQAGRVPTLEAERDTAVTERDQLRVENAQFRARESATSHARTRVTNANKQLPASTVDRIVAEATRTIPLTDAGELDESALDTAVDSARTTEESYLAGLAQAAGAGQITGFGAAAQEGGETVGWSDLDEAMGLTTKEA